MRDQPIASSAGRRICKTDGARGSLLGDPSCNYGELQAVRRFSGMSDPSVASISTTNLRPSRFRLMARRALTRTLLVPCALRVKADVMDRLVVTALTLRLISSEVGSS